MEPTLNLYQRLLAAQGETDRLQKNVSVSGFGGGYKGISGDDVVASCRSALRDNGVLALADVVSADQSETQFKSGALAYKVDVTVEVTFVNVDNPDERISVRGVGSGIDSGDKAPGKATTYAKKYALMDALLMSTHDQDEDRPNEELRPAPAQAEAPAAPLMDDEQRVTIKGLLAHPGMDPKAKASYAEWLEKPQWATKADKAIKSLRGIIADHETAGGDGAVQEAEVA